ncbi:MAG: MASE3 domain-containing protein [Gallionella sp.]|nr:MASE3 domain-containing protein [Gallionella sp.]
MQSIEFQILKSLHPAYQPAMRRIGAFLLLLAVVQFLAWLSPPQFDAGGISGYLPLHALFEVSSIVVAMMVFAVGWNAHSRTLPSNITVLACLFFAIGWLDFSHTIAYQGMPEFVTPNNADKQLNFWIAARLLAAIALLVVAIRPWSSFTTARTRYLLIGAMAALTLLINWLVLFHQDVLPRTFIPGEGLTPLKKNLEYLSIALNVITALLLWKKMREQQPFNVPLLFGAVCVMGMGEFFFTLYTTMTGGYNVLGHIYKVISYLFIYRAIVVETIEDPYIRLARTQENLAVAVRASNTGLWNWDLRSNSVTYSPEWKAQLGYQADELAGSFATWERLIHPDDLAAAQKVLHDFLGSSSTDYESEFRLQHRDGSYRWILSRGTKLHDGNGVATHLIGSHVDITKLKENEAVLRILAQRAKALLDLPEIAEQMDEKSFMQRGQEMAENLTGSEISFIHFVNNGGEEIELVAWSRRTLEHYCTAAYDSHYPLSQAGIWADALREGKPVVFNDYPSYPHKHGLPQGHSPLQRLISVPVIENGKVVMMTGVGNKKTDYTDLDIETVQLISHEIWHIVQRTRNKNKLTLFGRALDQSKYEIYILDPQTWLFMDANKGALDKIGYSQQELAHMTPLDLKPELTRESYAALLAPLLSAEKENIRFISHHRCKDGTLYPVEVHLEMTHDESPLLMQIVLDITERKNTEQTLRKSEALLKESQVIASLGSYMLDIKTGTWKASEELGSLWGIDANKDHTLVEWETLIHPEDRAMMHEYLENEVMGQGRAFDKEYRIIRHNDQAERWVHGLGKLILDTQGQPVTMYGTIQDITERKHTDTQLHEQLDELHRWQKTMLGRESRIISIKQEVNELLAKSGQPPRYADYVPDDSVPFVPQTPGGGDA